MSTPFTAVVVDDEPLARDELVDLLREHPSIRVLGEADGVDSAIELIQRADPDVVFLDIQMPPDSGFDLLTRTEVSFRVVFVTAYDEFAIRAFEVNALDYLLKPVRAERLAQTLDRLASGDSAPAGKKLDYADRVFITTGRQRQFVKISTIKYIQAAGNYSSITTTDRRDVLVLKALSEWEERLPETNFARVHRSTIVNTDFVDRVERWFNSSFVVFIKDEQDPLPMSRRSLTRLNGQL